MEEFPLIDHPDLKIGIKHCSGCGSEERSLEVFRLKTSSNARQIVFYCQECSEEIAIFLLQSWGRLGQTLYKKQE